MKKTDENPCAGWLIGHSAHDNAVNECILVAVERWSLWGGPWGG
jgi:hypothetical protein